MSIYTFRICILVYTHTHRRQRRTFRRLDWIGLDCQSSCAAAAVAASAPLLRAVMRSKDMFRVPLKYNLRSARVNSLKYALCAPVVAAARQRQRLSDSAE